jgi:hypothetical protein
MAVEVIVDQLFSFVVSARLDVEEPCGVKLQGRGTPIKGAVQGEQPL